jgi:hypothetical protein
MKSIVLSCDKYHKLAYHMILTYEKLWPTNQLTYLVPWNNMLTADFSEFNEKVQLVKTAKEFIPTIQNLLAECDENEWIFWSTDDTYLMTIDANSADITHKFVNSINDTDIYGVTFGNIRQVSKHVNKNDSLEFLGLNFIRRTELTNQWAHQYWRVKVLKKMFNCITEAPEYQAKQMDYMLGSHNEFWQYCSTGKFYTLDHNIATWGESTYRGKLTKNCVSSFNKYQIALPDDFEKSNKEIYFTP